MKYIFLSFLLLSLSSCFPFTSNTDSSPKENENSGVTVVSSGSENISVDSDGTIFMGNESGSTSSNDTEKQTFSSGEKNTISTETGVNASGATIDSMEKDPEFESIRNDINNLFSDIENGGK